MGRGLPEVAANWDPDPHQKRFVDWEIVDKLLMAGCTGVEIAAHLGVCVTTLYKKTKRDKGIQFAVYSQAKRDKGNTLLKAAQFDEAVNKRNISMLIWLGKSRLGQVETRDVNVQSDTKYHVVHYGDKNPKTYKDEIDEKNMQVIDVEPIKENHDDFKQIRHIPANTEIRTKTDPFSASSE